MSAEEKSWPRHPVELGQGTLIDAWRVVELLGAGGYGAVYKVEHVSEPGTWYALKLALHRGDKRTEREEQLLMGRAVHPNVVRLHASGRWPHPVDGHPYFVMSWVDGRALDTWAETLNPTFRQLAEKAGKVALALGVLHERGVLHRDLKPEHILLREGDGEPILIDLGVGYLPGADTLTFSALPPATPHLLSPEAVAFLRRHSLPRGARYETKPTDDLYALGVVLYRVVTGHYPFSPALPLDLLYAAIEGRDAPAPAAFNRRVPRALSDVLMRLLAKNPRERFQTGQELHEALVAAVTFGPAAAWDASLFEWEEVPQAEQAQGAPQRRIRRPQYPTEDSAPPPRRWLLAGWRHAPRTRGRLPQEGPARPQAAQQPRSRGPAWPYLVLVAALGAGLVGAKVLGLRLPASSLEGGSEPPRALKGKLPAGSPGQEVAQQVKSLETVVTAVPPQAVPTPAVVAAPATHTKDEAPMKKTTAAPPSTSTPPGKRPAMGAMSKALCTGAAAAALACSGAAVQVTPTPPPAPPPEPCPPGALEAMEKLGIRVGNVGTATFALEITPHNDPSLVSEGMVTIRYGRRLGRLPQRTLFSGTLIFGERAYGRFTWARSPDGTVDVPVCLELEDYEGGRGLLFEERISPNSAKVAQNFFARAVKMFK